MSETTIKDLPPEVLTKVLENLSISDMKSASLVCQLWNEIISLSSKFLDKISISINSSKKHLETAEDVKFCRKYRRFSIYFNGGHYKIDHINQNVINQISNCAVFIRHLDLKHIKLNGNQLLFFLKSCIFLEELVLIGVKNIKRIQIDCFERIKQVVFEKKLKMLYVGSSDWILKHLTIKNGNLDILYLECYGCTAFSTVLAFLHRLENVNIEKLHLNDVPAYLISGNFRLCPKFKWKKLKIANFAEAFHPGFGAIGSDAWNQILSVAQADSYISLTWAFKSEIPKILLESIAENKNITKLKINFRFDIGELFDRHQLKTFKYIKELEIGSYYFYHSEFPLSQFPNVETLKVSEEEIEELLLYWNMFYANFNLTAKVEEDSSSHEEFLNELIAKSFVNLYQMSSTKAQIFEIEIEDIRVRKTRQEIESEIFANRL